MNKYILLLISMILILACETGTRYDKNTTVKDIKTPSLSGVVIRSQHDEIEALAGGEGDFDDLPAVVLVEDARFLEPESQIVKSYAGGVRSDGLDVRTIRKGQHEGYVRLVFDVYDAEGKADRVGSYTAKYTASNDDIEVVINGYRKFSAPLPSFGSSSEIKQVYFEEYLDDSGFKFHIKLRTKAKVRIFDLTNPARLVFDIKPI